MKIMNYFRKGLFADSGSAKKLIIALFVWIFISSVFSSLGNIANNLCEDSTLGMKWLQFFSALGTFVIAPLGIALLISREPCQYLSIRKTNGRFFLLALIGTIVSIPFTNYVTYLNEQMVLPDFLQALEEQMKAMEERGAELTEDFLGVTTLGGFLANLIVLAIIPAVGEELLFRGIIQRSVTNVSKNAHIGIWTAAILFSAIHMQFYGFLPRMLLGALFGYFLFWSRSILVPMTCHFFNNAIIVCISYFYGIETNAAEEFGKEDILLGFISFCLLMAVCYMITREQKKENKKEELP